MNQIKASNQTTAIQRKSEILRYLNTKDLQDRFTALCGSDKAKETFKANLFNIALDNNLLECSTESIIKSALNIASLKLSLNKNLGKAYIVPRYKKEGNVYITEANIDIGYKGWLELARRSKILAKSYLIFKCDHFVLKIENCDEILEFEPNFELRQEHDSEWIKDNLRGVVVCLKDNKYNDTIIKFVPKETLFKIMQKNESVKKGKYSAYSDWLGEMLQAKALKYCLSKTAMSDEIGLAVSYDNMNEQDFTEQKKQSKINSSSVFDSLIQKKNNDIEIVEVTEQNDDLPF